MLPLFAQKTPLFETIQKQGTSIYLLDYLQDIAYIDDSDIWDEIRPMLYGSISHRTDILDMQS